MARIKLKDIKKYEQKTVGEVFEEYIAQGVMAGQRPLTIINKERFYKYSLLKWVKDDDDIKIFTEKFTTTIIVAIMKKGYKGSTYKSFVIRLKAFLGYCATKNYIKEFHIKVPKISYEKKIVYTENELIVLLKKPNLNSCLIGDFKGWATINVLIGTGCRSETLLNIKIEDLDFEQNFILFRHMKTKNQISIPMSNTLKTVLREYIQVLGLSAEMLLFPKLNGEKMCYDTLHQNITNYFKQRNIKMRGVNTFRNTFATMFIKNGGDIWRLKHLLGHSNIKTTERYINLLPLDMQEDLIKYNPLDILSKKNTRIKMKNKK